MIKKIPLIVLFLVNILLGQVTPNIAQVTNTIYLSPLGNDSNSGTMNDPVLTFDHAINQLPYGVNGDTIYSEVVFLEGYYNINTELRQACWQFYNGDGFKAISIRGEGNVVLDGTNALPVSGNFIELLGSRISIKNITLKLSDDVTIPQFWAAIDFKSAVSPCADFQTSNILIEDVMIDGCWDHGIHIDNIDTVLITNCEVKNTNLINVNGVTENNPNIGWGSGVKTRLSSNIEIRNCKIYNCWGEGISTARTTDIFVHNNEVYDNYSVNIYIDNVSNGAYKNNLCYATIDDNTYWRTQAPSSGFGVAAEYYSDNDYALNNNIKIYNNIILNAPGVYFDDNRTADEPKIAVFENIWFCNNSIVGWQGNTAEHIRAIRFDFADHDNKLLTFENIYLYNNLIALNEGFLEPTGNTQLISGFSTLPTTLFYGNNLWSVDPNHFSFYDYPFNINEDQINYDIPLFALPNSLDVITPNSNNNLIFAGTPFSFIEDDYFNNLRNGDFNIGAILPSEILATNFHEINNDVIVLPNPFVNKIKLISDTTIGKVEIFDILGKMIFQSFYTENEVEINLKMSNGIYFLKTKNYSKKVIRKM